jgi:hypothetical protein
MTALYEGDQTTLTRVNVEASDTELIRRGSPEHYVQMGATSSRARAAGARPSHTVRRQFL